MFFDKNKIRNFSIIAHIDHGKTTLADRILEITHAIDKRKMTNQFLDSMPLEKARKITIKLTAVTLNYISKNGEEYIFNLIDTPGHVDFNYEVSRSLMACEGVILVIDAARGVEAQTLTNLYLALDNKLNVVVAINKIDLPTANVERVKKEIENIGLDKNKVICISAKTGKNVENVLERVISDISAPKGDENQKLRALIFDSYYDRYRGVVILIKIVDGVINVGDEIFFLHSKKKYLVTELGKMVPEEVKVEKIFVGEVGYLCAQIKNIDDIIIGDTITLSNNLDAKPLIGCKKAKPMVYAGIFTAETNNFLNLKQALEKLKLNDAALTYEIEKSSVLGFGFRCGFLGLLHMDIVKERLEEIDNKLNLILTAPSVVYKVLLKNGENLFVDNPEKFPDLFNINSIYEPFVLAEISSPIEFIGQITKLCKDNRGIHKNIEYIDEKRVLIVYEMPLSEIIFLFFDHLKSCTRGYASLNYKFSEYKKTELSKIEVFLNGKIVDAFSSISHASQAYHKAYFIAEKLSSLLPRQLFEIVIQVAINRKIVVRKNISPLRKDVLAKCYGGDITRKKKLIEKQKEGKKNLKKIGVIEVPKNAFIDILSVEK
ncbi:MAG: elongation factor 4 [Bacilli bacterium]|nr:elongation factor 4 [Bacilli bacterium]